MYKTHGNIVRHLHNWQNDNQNYSQAEHDNQFKKNMHKIKLIIFYHIVLSSFLLEIWNSYANWQYEQAARVWQRSVAQ